MTENANQKGAQQKIETPSEAYGSGSASGFFSESAKNPKAGSDWLGGPQNGNETPSGSDYTKHRFDETPNVTAGKKTEGAYQTASHSTGYTDQSGSADWLGGPQNGNEIQSQDVDGSGETWSGRGKPTEAAGRIGTGNISGVATQTGSQAKGMGFTGPLNFAAAQNSNNAPSEASKQAPDRSGSQAYTDKLGGSSDN